MWYAKDQRGQTMVEFALILPIFLTIMFAIFQFGIILHDYIVVNEAAREGARIAAVGANDTAIINKVTSVVSFDSEKLALMKINISPGLERTSGSEVTVAVSLPKDAWLRLPYVGSYLPDNFNLEGKVVMRVEMDTKI